MTDYTDVSCRDCETPLIQLDGDFYCPSCDSLSGFEQIPTDDEFTL